MEENNPETRSPTSSPLQDSPQNSGNPYQQQQNILRQAAFLAHYQAVQRQILDQSRLPSSYFPHPDQHQFAHPSQYPGQNPPTQALYQPPYPAYPTRPSYSPQFQPDYPNQYQPDYPNQYQPGYPTQYQPGYLTQYQPNYPTCHQNHPTPCHQNHPIRHQFNYPTKQQPDFPTEPNTPLQHQHNCPTKYQFPALCMCHASAQPTHPAQHAATATVQSEGPVARPITDSRMEMPVFLQTEKASDEKSLISLMHSVGPEEQPVFPHRKKP